MKTSIYLVRELSSHVWWPEGTHLVQCAELWRCQTCEKQHPKARRSMKVPGDVRVTGTYKPRRPRSHLVWPLYDGLFLVTLWWTYKKNYGKSQFLMGKSTMAIFTSYVSLPEGTNYYGLHWFTNCGLWWVPDDLNCRWSLHYSQKWWKPHQKLKRLSPRFGFECFEAWHSTDLDFRCATGALLQGQCSMVFQWKVVTNISKKGLQQTSQPKIMNMMQK